MTADAATGFARALVDEWARAGVAVAAVAPGSRSTPLALALAADGRLRVEVFHDERSAAAFALGAAKASGRPAVVLTTSGSAATLLHGAVVEARWARAPLIAVTADRPPELRDTGASQAIDQVKLFGDAVRWFAEVGVPEDVPGAGRYWRSIGARSVAEALGPPAGAVHLNLAFREPLVPTGDPVDAPGRPDGAPWVVSPGRPLRSGHAGLPLRSGHVGLPLRSGDAGLPLRSGHAGLPLRSGHAGRPVPPDPDDVDRLAAAVAGSPRGLVVAGWGAGPDTGAVSRFAAAAGWPVLADTVSGLRTEGTVSAYDAILRHAPFAAASRPDLVLRLGAAPTGRAASGWLDASVRQVLVDPDGAWLDPNRAVAERVVADPGALLDALAARLEAPADTGWLDTWRTSEVAARAALDDLLDGWDDPSEGRIARDLVACLPDGTTLVAGSSMPVRDLESFARPRSGVTYVANRGASGIDGFASTVLGVAAVTGGPVAALCGDLTLLHDLGGLVGAARRGLDATLVVVDNDGGGIFSFLPQAANPEHFELLFGTPHGLDLTAVAAAFGIPAVRVTGSAELAPAVTESLAAGGVRLVIVPTDRADNVARHAQAWAAVASALG